MTAVIAASGLHKSFGDRPAMLGLDLQVDAGELLGLIGPNGAGKSTLLRSLVGLTTIDAGQLRVHDLDPAHDAVSVRKLTSYLPGETSVYQQMTGQQFLDFALGFHLHHHRELLARMADGFELPLAKRVRTYSAGMKQKLAVMAALAPDVPLYLLDEPDRALDAQMRFFLRELLLELKAAGTTIVLSSHHLSEVEALADRMQFLVEGRGVTTAALETARARLSRRLRLRLRPGTALPAGAELLRAEAHDTLLVHSHIEPLELLRMLPADSLLAAEVGIVRLEDLYQELLSAEPVERAT